MTGTSPQPTGTLHVVLGASGGAGNAIARALHEAGLRVRAVNRGGDADLPDGVERMAADITTPDGAARALAAADVVYLAAQPAYHRWPQEFPGMLRSVLGATPDGATLVMVDNLYGYGPGASPMSEDTPERATDRKGEVRRRMTAELMAEHDSGRIRVVIGRASDYLGPRADNSGVTALAIEPAAQGKRLRWAGSLDQPHSVAYLPDVARAYVLLGTTPEAAGRVWVLPHRPAVTGREFLALVNAALPEPLPTGKLSTTMLRLAAPFHAISREMLAIGYQWTQPFVVDDSRFRAAFPQYQDTPLPEAVATSVSWYRNAHTPASAAAAAPARTTATE
ncbi:MAG: NAD-dependent epimerase/dehydratase family protein [Candidatus Nanopelagicales bacterium]